MGSGLGRGLTVAVKSPPFGVTDLLHSEKGTFCVFVLLCATIMLGIGMGSGKVDFVEAFTLWKDFTVVVLSAYVGTKTIQGAVTAIVESRKPK